MRRFRFTRRSIATTCSAVLRACAFARRWMMLRDAWPRLNHTKLRRLLMLVRKALLHDASNIYDLVNSLSGDGTLLKRPFAEICENIRDFTVAYSDGGVFLGCGALHLYGPHLAEVRSIVVKPEAKSQGAGGGIVIALIEEAEMHGIQSVCLFTRIPDFFFKHGFRIVEDKSELPDKIFKDCQNCPRLHRCDEVAMVRGRIPRISILGPKHEAQELVRLSG